MSTARTRRLVSSSALMSSLVKMEVVYLLIAPSLRNRRPAMAVLERPSAIRARHGPFPFGEGCDRVRPGRPAKQFGHHGRVECRAAPGHPLEGVEKLLRVHHPVLELIANPALAVGEELPGVQLLHVLREDQHGQAGHLPAGGESGLQSLVGEGGRKAHVEDRHVGSQADQASRAAGPVSTAAMTE